MNNIIYQKEGYTLYSPLNEWDMNYHLIDDDGNDHLIDIGDVHDNDHDLEECGGILWDDLRTLFNLIDCRDVAWKTIGGEINEQ